MASIWSKTKLRRAEREDGFGAWSEEDGKGEDWEVEKGFRTKKRKGGLGFWDEKERRLRRRREKGVCAIRESERLQVLRRCVKPSMKEQR